MINKLLATHSLRNADLRCILTPVSEVFESNYLSAIILYTPSIVPSQVSLKNIHPRCKHEIVLSMAKKSVKFKIQHITRYTVYTLYALPGSRHQHTTRAAMRVIYMFKTKMCFGRVVSFQCLSSVLYLRNMRLLFWSFTSLRQPSTYMIFYLSFISTDNGQVQYIGVYSIHLHIGWR